MPRNSCAVSTEAALRAAGYVMILCDTHDRAELQDDYLRAMREQFVAGYVMVSAVRSRGLEEALRRGDPMVFVARHNPIGHNGRFLDDATATILEDSRFKILDDGLVGVPWLFENREEAAEFCAGLFGIVGLSLGEVADALDREIGFAEHGRGIALRWVLRRIVCEAV